MAHPFRNKELNEKTGPYRLAPPQRRRVVPRTAKPRLNPHAVLEDARYVDFIGRDQSQIQWFEAKHKEHSLYPSSKSGSNFLHLLADPVQIPEGYTAEQVNAFLGWLLKKYHTLLDARDGNKYTPIHVALLHQNSEFICAILSHPELATPEKILSETCQYGNCLHMAVWKEIRVIELMVEKCQRHEAIFLDKHPDNGNTPLHACMIIGFRNADDEILDEYNYMYEQLERLLNEDGFTFDDDAERRGEGRISRRTTLNSYGDTSRRLSSVHEGSIDGNIESAYAISYAEDPAMQIAKLLVESCPVSLMRRNKHGRTPYQERIYRLQTSEVVRNLLDLVEGSESSEERSIAREHALRAIIVNDPVASFIRAFCIRHFNRDDIMTSLYQPGEERQIEFDLAGMPKPVISRAYLERLEGHVQFESILKYVALPKLTIRTPVRGKKKISEQATITELNNLGLIFEWLRERGVKKIVKVLVIDDGDASHTDERIEEALRGFDVEEWDWKKLDLCSDVIKNCTTVVREISLYSSGNNAVLMGWASEHGLLDTAAFPMLNTVNMFIRPGHAGQERLNKNIETFKSRVNSQSQSPRQPIRVHVTIDDGPVSRASIIGDEEPSETGGRWMKCMEDFATYVDNARVEAAPLKIAVIDDGIDATLATLEGRIAGGQSFCPYPNSTDLMSPYFVPSGNHGTQMAQLICKFCPKARLYVARLHERIIPGSGERQITADSAADAVNWAVSCGVDIISMSWTIEAPIQQNEGLKRLREAIVKASLQRILMFCSTSDQGIYTKDECWPGNFGGCIRVGAAASTGVSLNWVNEDKVDFLLPGKNIPCDVPGTKEKSYESGSSLATAIASGLVGALIYCTRLLDVERDFDFRDRLVLEETLKAMSGNGRFLKADEIFSDRFKQEIARDRGRSPSSIDLRTEEWSQSREALLRVLTYIKTRQVST
ncbi:hypothetical protein F4779DRAFT_34502 [Xylariaceae sp. FL0662B]|nr:hypothetical protein F4779DRAFT_34502 [Xylariaceae sp. FL0662B]